MRIISMLFVLLFISVKSMALGKIAGKVTDEKSGETLIGASVSIKGTATGTIADVDGNYILSVAPGTYTVLVKYIGYQAKEVADVKVTNNATVVLDVVMTSAATDLKEVVITSTLKKENTSAMITFQKNTNTVAQVVSAEAIRRSPDRNTGEVLKRVSSASIQEGKYLVVRGLADRYNQATLNGALLSSTEPDRKTFSFDLFPSGMIDNIVINKAATPDLPAEFAGGLIQVNTKDFPSQNFLTIQAGAGSNSQTLGKDFYYYEGGKLDFLGIDDGTRALPASFVEKDQFRSLSADDRLEIAKDFKNDWGYKKKTAPINANVQISGGLNTNVLKKKLGAIFALNYNKQNKRTDITRTFYNQSGALQKTLDFSEQSYTEEVLWGALANITLELNKNHKISFKNLYNINGLDNTLIRNGRNNDYGADVSAYQLGFKSTKFLTSQLMGSHFLGKSKIRINWNGSYVRLRQDQPNLRRMEYRKSDGDSVYMATVQGFLPSLSSASRFYSDLTDNVYIGNADVAYPFELFGQTQNVKVGYMIQSKDRIFNSRPIGMVGGTQEQLTLGKEEIFSEGNLASSNGFNVNELADKDYDYTAGSVLNAGFAMLDNSFGEKIKLVWGVRYENYTQILNGFRSNKPVDLYTITGDFLPSVNLTYKHNDKTNFRFSASQTVIRPEFRELSPFTFYDFELLAAVQGNPDLKRTKITNLDLRYELYPRPGEMVTAGVFYKYFQNTIEQFYNESGVNTFSFTFGNAPVAVSYGLELEFRKRLDFIGGKALEPFTVFANGSYIYNNVDIKSTDAAGNEVITSRPMQGQSPYVLNTGLQFDADKSGTSATVLYNMIGRRIFLVGNAANPHIWEAPRPLLDFQVAQKLLKKKAEVKLNVSDIFNKRANFYQDKDENGKYNADADFLRISRKMGTNFSLSFSYNF